MMNIELIWHYPLGHRTCRQMNGHQFNKINLPQENGFKKNLTCNMHKTSGKDVWLGSTGPSRANI